MATKTKTLPQPVLDAIAAQKALLPSYGWQPPKGAKQQDLFLTGYHDAEAWEREILSFAHGIDRYLSWGYEQICDEAATIPGRVAFFARSRSPLQTLELFERLFGVVIPGRRSEEDCVAYLRSQLWPGRSEALNTWFDIQPCLLRLLNVKFWRRVLWSRVLQAREELHLRLRLVGKKGAKYVSEDGLAIRKAQRARRAEYMKKTTIEATIEGEVVSLPLEQVASSAEQRMSKIYAFIAAMDRMAIANGLTVALITATLEGEWHPNPSHGRSDTQWNGKTPKQANEEMGRRWAAVRRDLDNLGVRLSGIWAGEPHADACPHRHFWTIYRPEHAHMIYEAFARYFPGTPGVAAAVKVRHPAIGDICFDTHADAAALNMRFAEFDPSDPKGKKTELAQVEFSVIDRSPSKPGEPRKASGASYAFKYIEAAMLAEHDDSEKGAAFARIDAHRSIWRMRAYQFFGIKDCLSLWDELRRVQEPPLDALLHSMWIAARGGEAKGRVQTGTQRGDAWAFLMLHGGLAVFEDVTGSRAALKEFKERVRAGEEVVRDVASLAREGVTTAFLEPGSTIVGVQRITEAFLPVYSVDEDGVVDTYLRGERAGFRYVYELTTDKYGNTHYLSGPRAGQRRRRRVRIYDPSLALTKPKGWSWQALDIEVQRTRLIQWCLKFAS